MSLGSMTGKYIGSMVVCKKSIYYELYRSLGLMVISKIAKLR